MKKLVGLVALSFILTVIGCGGGGGGAPPDTLPPEILDPQVSPQQLRFTGGEFEISARVSDPSGVERVWAVVEKPDGTKQEVGLSLVGGAYKATFQTDANTRNDEQAETYKVWVRARDGKGNETPLPGVPSDGIIVTVQAPKPPPNQPSFP